MLNYLIGEKEFFRGGVMKRQVFIDRLSIIENRLYKMAYLYLGNEADALEVMGETTYKALKNIKKLREEAYFETWVTRILINECQKELKRRKRFVRKEIEEQDLVAKANFDELPLQEAIQTLPEDLKLIIILRFFSQYKLKEVAEYLEMPQGTVVTKQRQALKLLKLELGGHEDE